MGCNVRSDGCHEDVASNGSLENISRRVSIDKEHGREYGNDGSPEGAGED